jgi:hypothetical protein
MGALYAVCGPFLVNLRTPFLLSVLCGNIVLCVVVWLTVSLQEALLWLVNLDLASIGFFLHYRALFRLGTFTPEHIGCWVVPSLFLANRAYAASTPLFVAVAVTLFGLYSQRWARALAIDRVVKERSTRPHVAPTPTKLDLSPTESGARVACSAAIAGQAIVDKAETAFQETEPVTPDMPKQAAVFRLFVVYTTTGPSKTRVWGVRRSTGFFFSRQCALTVLHAAPSHPQTAVVAMFGTTDLSARLEDLFPSLTADLQEGLRHHLPSSLPPREGPPVRIFWFRAATTVEDAIRTSLQDLALELGFPAEDLHPYRVHLEDLEDVGLRAAQGELGPSDADFLTKVTVAESQSPSPTPYTWPQYCDIMLLRSSTPAEDVIPLDTSYSVAPTNMLLSFPAAVYGYPTSSVFREHYRNVLPQLNHLAKRSMLMQCFCYYNKKVRSSGGAWLPPALAPHARIADTRLLPELISKSPEMVREYHRQLGFVSCSAELEMAGAPVVVNGCALGLHIGCVAVENRNLFLFIHHPMVVVYLYLRCHKEEGMYAFFNGHVGLLRRVVNSAAWHQLQSAYEELQDLDA